MSKINFPVITMKMKISFYCFPSANRTGKNRLAFKINQIVFAFKLAFKVRKAVVCKL